MVVDGGGWWWMVVDGGEWWWMVVDGGEWWWMVDEGVVGCSSVIFVLDSKCCRVWLYAFASQPTKL